MPFTDSRCVSDMSVHLLKPRQDRQGLLNTFHQVAVGDSWSTWLWFWSVWPLPGGDPNLHGCDRVGEHLRVGPGFLEKGRRWTLRSVSGQRQRGEVGMWIREGWDTTGTGVSTGTYVGIKGLNSEGTSWTSKPAPPHQESWWCKIKQVKLKPQTTCVTVKPKSGYLDNALSLRNAQSHLYIHYNTGQPWKKTPVFGKSGKSRIFFLQKCKHSCL